MHTVLQRAKQGLLVVLCFAFLLSMCLVDASAASVYVRPQKHIYLVLDDSGSMTGRPEDDANYALQTLVAMTDKTDTINIYFLNKNSKIDGELDLLNKSDALINTIKVDYPKATGGTPYTAVSKAQKDLKNKVTADDQGEYWLIVVTDGGFTYPIMDYGQDLENFASTQLKNGKYPQVMTVSINGASVITGDARNKDNVFCIENADVIPSMNEAAKAISDRVEVSDYVLSADGKTLDFKTPYPASNIIVLAQNTQTSIAEYTCISKLNTTEKYKVAHPAPTTALDTSTVCFITEESGGSIASGPVTLKFTDPIEAENLVILVEPAIALIAHYYSQDGTECDPGDLLIGEKAKVVFTICDPATQQPIDVATIDGGVKYSADIDGQHHEGNEIEFEIEDKDLTIDLFAEFSDGFVLDIHNAYSDLKEYRIISMALSDGGNFSEDINHLGNEDFITATVRVNGALFSEKEFAASTLEIKGGNLLTSRFKITPDPAKGTFTIYPRGGLFKVFTPQTVDVDVVFTTPKGEVVTERLTVALTGPRNWIPFILAILGLALLIYLIWVYSVKPKFPFDLQLRLFLISPKGKVNIAGKATVKTLFSKGVLDWKSVLPHPGPFIINLNAVNENYNSIRLVATKEGRIFVTGVKCKDGSLKKPEYKASDDSATVLVGFDEAGDSKTTKYKGQNVLVLKQQKRCLYETAHSPNRSKKFLQVIRKKDLKKKF